MCSGNKGNRKPRGGPDYRQGFRALTPEHRSAIARLGGLAAAAQGVGHKWTRDTARAASRKYWDNRRANGSN